MTVKVKKGDRIRFTAEGEVTWVPTHDPDGYFEIDGACYYSSRGTVEIIQKPLTVGDIVTEENKHLLPKQFILASAPGHAWGITPYGSQFKQYGPFTLVYIHDAK